jgi:Na+-driven multidrug efflux pump
MTEAEPDIKKLLIPEGGIKRVLKRIPMLMYVMLAGLALTTFALFSKLAGYLADPKPLKMQEDYILLIALLLVIPLCLIGLFALSYGFVSYQIYKQDKAKQKRVKYPMP